MNGTFWALTYAGTGLGPCYCGRCRLGKPGTWGQFRLADPQNAYQLRCTKCYAPLAGAIVIGPNGVDRYAEPEALRWIAVPS